MTVEVIVPFRGGDTEREAAWSWVRAQYATIHPDWDLVEASASPGAWCKAAAVNPAVQETRAEVVVLADADVWTDGLEQAVAAVEEGAPWAVPHRLVHRLSRDGTAAVLTGSDWRGQALDQRPYCGLEGGGILVAPREALLRAPLDRRFLGWGQEDECHALALKALIGAPWRGEADLLHLFHEPQTRHTRRRGSRESWQLRCRYFESRRDPDAMAALLEDADALPAAEHPVHDHSAPARH